VVLAISCARGVRGAVCSPLPHFNLSQPYVMRHSVFDNITYPTVFLLLLLVNLARWGVHAFSGDWLSCLSCLKGPM
jgi:hypothetical protein